MYSRMMVWLFVLGGFSTILIVACVLVGIAAITISIIWLKKRFSDYKGDDEMEKSARKGAIFISIIFAVILAISSFVPSQKTVLTYLALRTVDSYNATHETSNLRPEKVIGTADEIMEVINSAMEKAEKMLKANP